jgi:hypothetical protein
VYDVLGLTAIAKGSGMFRGMTFLALVLLSFVPLGCDDDGGAAEADTDADTDTDSDMDTDADSDSDTDADTDSDTDTGEEQPGEDDVWVRVTVSCDICDTAAPVVIYGYEGDTPGTIPDIYNKISDGLSFPLTVEIKETGAMSVGPFVEGPFIVAAYQDLDDAGMGPEDGEPISEYASVDLVKGEWNEIDLTLVIGK